MNRHRVLFGFMALGFCLGVGSMGLEYVAGHSSPEVEAQLDAFAASWGRILCPASFGFMDLESENMNNVGIILAGIIFGLENSLVYALIGTVIGETVDYLRARKRMIERQLRH